MRCEEIKECQKDCMECKFPEGITLKEVKEAGCRLYLYPDKIFSQIIEGGQIKVRDLNK